MTAERIDPGPPDPPDEVLALELMELGPRARDLLDYARKTGRDVIVRSRGRHLARLVPLQGPGEDDEPFGWDIEAIAP